MKHLSSGVMGKQIIPQAEFTLLIQFEAILKSKPITEMSTDPNDFVLIRPGYFLIGQAMSELVVHIDSDRDIPLKSSTKLIFGF